MSDLTIALVAVGIGIALMIAAYVAWYFWDRHNKRPSVRVRQMRQLLWIIEKERRSLIDDLGCDDASLDIRLTLHAVGKTLRVANGRLTRIGKAIPKIADILPFE